MLKIKKIISGILSVAVCTAFLTTTAAAAEADYINTIQGQLGENVEISQLSYDNSLSAQLNDLMYGKISFDNADESEDDNISVSQSEPILSVSGEQTANDNVAVPYSTAVPLSSLGITDVFLGSSDTWESGVDKWVSAFKAPTSQMATTLNLKIDATKYEFICFRVYQGGYQTAEDSLLDNKKAFHALTHDVYNQWGQHAGAGDIAYAFHDDYIFEIPKGKSTSTANFRRYYNQSGLNIVKEATVNITWTTPTGPAPTTPEIIYNIPNANDYAAVTGLSTDMEYCLVFDEENDSKYWNDVTAETMYADILDEPYTLLIRYKKSTNGNPSLSCSIPVKARETGPTTEYIGYYVIDEILAIYQSERQIEIALGDGMSYIPVSAGYYYISDFIDNIAVGGFNRIYIRYAATADEPASYSSVLTLYGRNPNTPDNVYYQNGVLYNLTSDMAFRFNGSNWYSTNYSAINVTSFMSNSETTLLEIKYIPTDTYSCSATLQLILPALSGQ